MSNKTIKLIVEAIAQAVIDIAIEKVNNNKHHSKHHHHSH